MRTNFGWLFPSHPCRKGGRRGDKAGWPARIQEDNQGWADRTMESKSRSPSPEPRHGGKRRLPPQGVWISRAEVRLSVNRPTNVTTHTIP